MVSLQFKFRSLPLAFNHFIVPLIVGIISIIAYLFDALISDFLVYQLDAINNGQLWRLLTGHLFHTNGYHLLLNLCALILLWALHGQFYSKINYFLLFILSAVTCSAGLYFFSPDLHQYVGLSGVLHGIFIFGALSDIKYKDKTGYLLFAGAWLKILHEQIYGASSDVVNLIEANVAVDAHLWGAVGGLLFFICHYLITYSDKNNSIKATQ